MAKFSPKYGHPNGSIARRHPKRPHAMFASPSRRSTYKASMRTKPWMSAKTHARRRGWRGMN